MIPAPEDWEEITQQIKDGKEKGFIEHDGKHILWTIVITAWKDGEE